jgi:cytochrome oxidase assembly protein ShyY1
MFFNKNTDSKQKEPWSILKTLIALLLFVLCLWGAQWQYQRGVDRHERNTVIKERITQQVIRLDSIQNLTSNAQSYEWRIVRAVGEFDKDKQILLRNRYFEGKYGFQVLTLFRVATGEKFWVDRGWVKAGETALTKPTIPLLPDGQVEIEGRIRLDSSLPRGAFFAISATGEGIVSKLNAQSQLETEKYYIDLMSGSQSLLTPAVPAQLPELSDGPHMAYALQWVFFGGLIVYGRILIRRPR